MGGISAFQLNNDCLTRVFFAVMKIPSFFLSLSPFLSKSLPSVIKPGDFWQMMHSSEHFDAYIRWLLYDLSFENISELKLNHDDQMKWNETKLKWMSDWQNDLKLEIIIFISVNKTKKFSKNRRPWVESGQTWCYCAFLSVSWCVLYMRDLFALFLISPLRFSIRNQNFEQLRFDYYLYL